MCLDITQFLQIETPNKDIVTIPPELVNPDAKYIQFVYLPTPWPRHPLAEYFPISGELDPNLHDVERDDEGRIPDTAGVYEVSKYDKELIARFKKNPNHPDFARRPPIIASDGTEIIQQFEFERAKYDNHSCPNCPFQPITASYSQSELDHALRIPITENNPYGCFDTSGTQTFETRVRDNRSITIVCETEGKVIFI